MGLAKGSEVALATPDNYQYLQYKFCHCSRIFNNFTENGFITLFEMRKTELHSSETSPDWVVAVAVAF